ncbi:MAG: ABC transporter substrate-binding protein [Bacteroidales bacterium]
MRIFQFLRNIKYVFKGLLLILLIGLLILYSDRHNRRRKPAFNFGSSISQTEKTKPEKGKIYKIGIAYFAPEEGFDNLMRGFFEGMRQLGFVKDSNLQVVMSHANAEFSNLTTMLQNLDNQDLDLIVPTSTPVIQASLKSVRNKPMVFTYCYDPIGAGVGTSYTEHLPNITGVGSFPPVEETIDFILQVKTGIKKIGTLYNSSEANSRKAISVGREILKKKGIQLEEITVTNTNEVHQASQVLASKKIEAVWITGDNTAIQSFDAIIANTDKAGLPVIVNDQEMVDKGAIAAVGIGWYSTGFHSAEMVARVLCGAETKSIPIENFAEKDLVINHHKVKALGVKVPDKLYRLAEYGVSEIKTSKKLQFILAQYSDAPISEFTRDGILLGFKEMGLVKGKDFELVIQNAQGDIGTVNNIISNAANGNYDIIFVTSTPTLQVAAKKIKNTPLVFTLVADPIKAGAGKSFEVHQPNITGISTLGDFKGGLICFKKIMPGMKTVGTIFTPGEVNSVNNLEVFKNYARQMNIEVIAVPVTSPNDIPDAALSLVSKPIDAVCQILDNLTSASFGTIAKAAHNKHMPVFGFVSEQADHGAIATVSRDYIQSGKDAVGLAARIINGEKPADIPFSYVSKSEIVINKKAARYYQVTIPKEVEKSAVRIIQ